MSDGFLGRWSRRKLDAVQGKPLPEDPPAAPDELQERTADAPSPPRASAGAPLATSPGASAAPVAPEVPPPPTLEEVRALTAESDFTRFAARDVAPEVKNAALKKLFADPRYNVMDGMDVYIDDYSKPDPLPLHMLRQLASAATLKLFEDVPAAPESPAPAALQPRDVADNPTVESVAQCGGESPAVPEPIDDDHPDLRLQQDDAAAGGPPGDDAG